ncbi:UNVERIFIED_CONTAM: Benzoate carboxyl methyltransferase [Sesamum angustifolium]|uniref:Benzoate carboxyl methyltransferase n=1 Tax=Sesamum angustifolium TaxID=2727405 RepID=A0AAW2N9U1_9LAMI
MASPPEVFEAYMRKYQRDFSIFLSCRGEEIAPGGRMVLTFVGRSVADPSSKDGAAHFTLLADTLLDMINEGLIKEADLHSFNMPIYTPSKQEVEAAILSEGSFTLYKLEDFLVPWDAHVEHSNSNNHRPTNTGGGNWCPPSFGLIQSRSWLHTSGPPLWTTCTQGTRRNWRSICPWRHQHTSFTSFP